MSFKIIVIERGQPTYFMGEAIAYLISDYWNDYSYRTLFYLIAFDNNGKKFEIGNVKIGFIGQTEEQWTSKYLNKSDVEFFSLGQDVDYYKNIVNLPDYLKLSILDKLSDVVAYDEIFNKVMTSDVYIISLSRFVSNSVVTQQFRRVLNGKYPLTEFNFDFISDNRLNKRMNFHVVPDSVPPSNIHVMIGRNGAGKTTILNRMVDSLLNVSNKRGCFIDRNALGQGKYIDIDYFSRGVFVSFSAFDTFKPSEEFEHEFKFDYIGLRDVNSKELKSKERLSNDFIESLKYCLTYNEARLRWNKAISFLAVDESFDEVLFIKELNCEFHLDDICKQAHEVFMNLSSGHAIVLLTITQLIVSVSDKTIVLMDEPEGHLHPPLLSAFICALSDLLIDRNGVAIIATHSPVVIQETPKSCVWNILKYGDTQEFERLELETYAENVGVLTREVFGLEVRESGFHKALKFEVDNNKTYEDILRLHKDQIGFEGRSILKTMVYNRRKKG
ncbi:AAA family ATPase [Vibrio parahaemolyticus]